MKHLCTIIVLSGALTAIGCDNTASQPFSEVREVEPPSPSTAMPASSNPHAGIDSSMASAPSGGALDWTTPPGWEEREQSAMRIVNLGVEGEPATECFVTRLGGTGGGIEANLNRWRSQMSLPPLSSEEIAALPTLKILGVDAVTVEMTGDYAGMGATETQSEFALLGAVAESNGATYFIKMTGPADVIARERENFNAFCASLSTAAPTAMASAGADPHAGLLTTTPSSGSSMQWTAPASWSRASDRPMREVTFTVNGAECYVATLRGMAGGVEANINRWRTQMGQAALSPSEIGALETLTVMGKPATLVEIAGAYTGMDGSNIASAMMLGVVVEDPVESVFIKMIGPESAVQAERDNFVAFCESIK